MIQDDREFIPLGSDDDDGCILIPCRWGKLWQHQYGGTSCDQFCFQGWAIPVKIENHSLLNLIGFWDRGEYEYPEEKSRNDAKDATKIAEILGVEVSQVEILGEALVKIGTYYIAIENSD